MSEVLATQEGRISLLICIENAMRLGLQPGGVRKHFYIVPFKSKNADGSYSKKAVFIPTMDGLLSIVLTPPPVIRDINVQAYYEGETIRIDMASGKVEHPVTAEQVFSRSPDKIKGFYAVVTKLNGMTEVTPMGIKEIYDIRDKVNAKNKGESTFWRDYFVEMATKTVFKRALKKYLGLKEGLAMAVDYDDRITGSDQDYDDMPIDEQIITGIDESEQELKKVQELKKTDDAAQMEIF